MRIRAYQPNDASAIMKLFVETVHTINAADYSPAQLEAWAPQTTAPHEHQAQLQHWQRRLDTKRPFVAEWSDVIVGFAELEPDGHIDCFYVHRDYQRRGVGARLMAAVETEAKRLGLERLHAEVSITALPFFEAHGFRILAKQSVEVRGVALNNYRMERRSSTTYFGKPPRGG